MKDKIIRRPVKKDSDLEEIIRDILRGPEKELKKVLILPPDLSRMHSGAGRITAIIYRTLKDSCEVGIMPALGTHDRMTEKECLQLFGPDVPYERIFPHDWKKDTVTVGKIPASLIKKVSEGKLDYSISVDINKRLLDKTWDLIISVGQVVPHEVAGMANYSKNVLVGCGGSDIINKSHMLGAVFGMERIMGEGDNPVRRIFDYAQERFLAKLPLTYILTVTTACRDDVTIEGIFAGKGRNIFAEAVDLSRQKNITVLDRRIKKVVANLDEREFKSTWLGNKAIYRTRMAIADGGELLILAPGVKKFGEDEKIDRLIRKYGYVGKEAVLKHCTENSDLMENLSAAAHLIHGSSEGRFTITYATKHFSAKELRGVNFGSMSHEEAVRRYDPDKLVNGYNTLPDGEEVFYISNPALGLWKAADAQA